MLSESFKYDLIYQLNIWTTLSLLFTHIGALYGLYLGVTSSLWQTIVMCNILASLTGIGTLTASHRYYSHKSFKAKLPLRVILCILQTLTGQKSIIEWARDHRAHHKFVETDADTVNIKRGFFFAHMGWLMLKTHPECEQKRKELDISDLWSDPLIRFQYHYYTPLVIVFNAIIPTLIPYYLFNETLVNGFFICFLLRYAYILQMAFCGNSVAHIWGTKPYDTAMTAVHNETLIYATQGGAYHNYHHVFPWDYSESEFGCAGNFNLNTAFIDAFAAIGWAYDLKKAPKNIITMRRERTGDKADVCHNPVRQFPVWDWIFGLFFSCNIIWIILPLRYIFAAFTRIMI